MADRNPFELEGREGGPERAHAARAWTPEEIADKLTGYLEVPSQFWDQIRYGTHVRYFTKGEGFRPGGFVSKNPFDTKPRGLTVEKRFMRLQNGFSDKVKGYASWLVAYEDLEKVYIKPDAATLVMLQILELATKGLNENIRKLAVHSRELEQRLAVLERK